MISFTDKELQLGKKVYTIGFPQSFILGDTEIVWKRIIRAERLLSKEANISMGIILRYIRGQAVRQYLTKEESLRALSFRDI